MDDTTGRVGRDGLTHEDEARTREIREEIVQTRAELSETIEAIQERLTPSHLVAQAGESVRNATTEKVKEMANTAGRAADQFMDSPVVETVRSNPIPAVMIGVGTAWLLMKGRGDAGRNRRDRGRREYSGYRPEWRVASSAGYETDTAGAIGTTGATGSAAYGTTGSGAYGSSESAGYGAAGAGGYGATGSYRSSGYGSGGAYSGEYGYRRSSGFSLERVARENPLALGAAAALVGVAIGLTVPSTETEDRLMGETRDNVVDKAREVAGDAVEKVQDAAQSTANAAASLRGEVTPNTESPSRPPTARTQNARGRGTPSAG